MRVSMASASAPMKKPCVAEVRNSSEDFANLREVLKAIAELRCSMYDHALILVPLANRLVSLSEVLSTRILETFAGQ